MLCMLFNVYISTIRYVLLISSFCRWGKQGTEKPRNLLLVTHEPEKLGFQPCSLAIEPQLPISELCCLLTNGSSPWAVDSHYRRNDCGNTHIPQIYVYTQTHTPIHTRFKRLKWCITYKVWQFAYVCIYVIQLYIIDLNKNLKYKKSLNFFLLHMSKESSFFMVYITSFLLQFEQSNIYFNKI